MTSYSAQVSVDGGTLHTSRPLTAPEQVAGLIESVVYQMREAAGGDVVSITLQIDTADVVSPGTAGGDGSPDGGGSSGPPPLPPVVEPQPPADAVTDSAGAVVDGGGDTPIGDAVASDVGDGGSGDQQPAPDVQA